MGEWITLDTHYGPVRAWQATPEGKPRGGLVVIQEIFGANPHIRAVADDYAAKGYAVLAPSFFDLAESAPDSTEPPELPYDSDGVAAGLAMVDELGVEKALEIVRAAASRLAPAGKVGTALGQLLRGPQREIPGRDAQGAGHVPLRRAG
jgi:carboxymethylenebutenolidase